MKRTSASAMTHRPTTKRLLGAMLLAALLAGGCSSSRPPQYEWGSYEDLVYKTYHAPQKATPEIQVEKLSKEIHAIESRNGLVGPGVYAHLGYMYFLLAQFELAQMNFDKELALFPESKPLVDRLKSGLEKSRRNL